MLPDYLSDLGQGTGLREFADQMFGMSLERVHEVTCVESVRGRDVCVGIMLIDQLPCT